MNKIPHYLEMCKPKVVALMLFSSVIGMVLAIDPGQWPWLNMIIGLIGIGAAAAGGAVLNHLIDQHFDTMMLRTQKRPIPKRHITNAQALIFAMSLGVIGTGLLLQLNPLATYLTLSAMLGYAIVYTHFLKHKTPQNIVIGGLSGALPPLLGWVCLKPEITAEPLLLALIIFAWTPPHFWALAIYRLDDYAQAKIPMLPVTHGVAYTHLHIKLYAWLTALITLLPVLINMFGWLYTAGWAVLNAWFLRSCYRMRAKGGDISAMKTFKDSIFYLTYLFAFMLLDHFIYLPIPWS